MKRGLPTPKRQCSIKKLDLLEAVRRLKLSVEPVMVQFKASWCGACAANEPQLQEAACDINKMEGIELVQIDVDENPMIAQEFGVENLPTIAIVHHGKIVAKEEGVNAASHWRKMAKDWLKKNGYEGEI